MPVTAHTTDTWTKYGEHVLAQIQAAKKHPYVKAGILQKDFEKPKDEPDGKGGVTKSTTETLGEVAVDNEFGSSVAPARSFMRSTTDEKRDSWQEFAERLWPQVVAGEGKVHNLALFLAAIGLKMETDIKAKIRSNVGPPNAPSTIARKVGTSGKTGRAARALELAYAFGIGTLRNTGQMLNAIASEVVNGGGK